MFPKFSEHAFSAQPLLKEKSVRLCTVHVRERTSGKFSFPQNGVGAVFLPLAYQLKHSNKFFEP